MICQGLQRIAFGDFGASCSIEFRFGDNPIGNQPLQSLHFSQLQVTIFRRQLHQLSIVLQLDINLLDADLRLGDLLLQPLHLQLEIDRIDAKQLGPFRDKVTGPALRRFGLNSTAHFCRNIDFTKRNHRTVNIHRHHAVE